MFVNIADQYNLRAISSPSLSLSLSLDLSRVYLIKARTRNYVGEPNYELSLNEYC